MKYYTVNMSDKFHIRDYDTKEVKITFRSLEAAKIFLSSLNFGNANFYVIWDNDKKKIAYEHIKHYRGHNKNRVRAGEIQI